MTSTATIPDRGETLLSIEPLVPAEASPHRGPLGDRVVDLIERSAALREAIPPALRAAVADAVRSMNCYYSNLIEGHYTHPIDIERALAGDFSTEPEKRDLQLEARAHIEVQGWIDSGGLSAHPMAPDSLAAIHARFCAGLPDDLLWITAPDGSRMRLVPGALRVADVQVGRHVAPSPGAVPRLLEHMHRMYGRAGRLGAVISVACAHHRLMHVHPFADLNGRVGRMVSHAWLREVAGSEGLWSVSRGLARSEAEYKRRLMAADDARHGGADGRGTLSEARLAEFAGYFLDTCIDQVAFMTRLMQPQALRGRILDWAAREVAAGRQAQGAEALLREALYTGAVPRAAVPQLLGVGERQARKVTSQLVAAGALASATSRAPLVLSLSPRLAPDWLPGLFPEGHGTR